MSEPVFSERVLAAMGPALAERGGELTEPVVSAYCAEADSLDALLEPTADGWPILVDLDSSLYPEAVGRATGTQVPAGMVGEEARAYVRERASWRRGTPRAMLAAAREVYPTGAIALVERDGSPWRTTIRLYAGEATEADKARIIAAVSVHKPVGIVLTVVRVTGASWGHFKAHHGPSWGHLLSEFGTWEAMTTHIPEEGT